MHEAVLYKEVGNNNVKCTACKHSCVIKPDHTGLCGVRHNINGKLYLLVYGKAAGVNVDPVEKKPLFHFLPGSKIFSLGTVGCNFGCSFCQNWDISQVTRNLRMRLLKEKKPRLLEMEIDLYGYELPPEKVLETCRAQEIPAIAYTYNEPVIFFEYLYDIAKQAHAHGIRNVFVSNGYESEEALEKIKPYLDGMNIDLKAFTNEFYTKFCKARLEPVLETIKKVHTHGIWLEITTLVIPGKNDSTAELTKIAEFIASVDKTIPWHVTAFHPDHVMKDVPSTSYESLFRAHAIGKKSGLKYVYVGNILDEERESTYCPSCNALLIRRNGYFLEVEQFKNGKCTACGERIPGVWT